MGDMMKKIVKKDVEEHVINIIDVKEPQQTENSVGPDDSQANKKGS